MFTHFSLCSGIGGIDLAAEWAGFETVGQCELADYPHQILNKHWPLVPKWRDIKDVTKQSVKERGIGPITLLSGGIPCQPFSNAGKRRGTDDNRHLWPEMFRIIRELQPHWVLVENVANFTNLALDGTCVDLESEGYEVQSFNIPACAVDAKHQRKRIFILANSNRFGHIYSQSEKHTTKAREYAQCHITTSGKTLANTTCKLSHRNRNSRPAGGFKFTDSSEIIPNTQCPGLSEWQGPEGKWSHPTTAGGYRWPVEPPVGRVANGISSRVDRLKCLGNAVVPQQVFPILYYIGVIENCLTYTNTSKV